MHIYEAAKLFFQKLAQFHSDKFHYQSEKANHNYSGLINLHFPQWIWITQFFHGSFTFISTLDIVEENLLGTGGMEFHRFRFWSD